MTHDKRNPVFNPGQAEWVQQKGTKKLDEDQKALLLALSRLEAEIGRELGEEERTAIESLAVDLEGFDADEILRAVHQMVNQPADPRRKVSWSELKGRLH